MFLEIKWRSWDGFQWYNLSGIFNENQSPGSKDVIEDAEIFW
jgi:hypothetical protein